jgi:hypothetical protein
MIFYLTLLNLALIGISSIVTTWYVSIPSIIVSTLIIILATKKLYSRYVND